jgi:hypothetical protein
MPRSSQVALALTVLAAIAGSGACSHEMSDREYCTRRQMAWEMAFPNLAQTDDDRAQYVDACVANVGKAHDNGELARSRACMNDLLVGHGHAREQFDAFTRCEQVDPSREH